MCSVVGVAGEMGPVGGAGGAHAFLTSFQVKSLDFDLRYYFPPPPHTSLVHALQRTQVRCDTCGRIVAARATNPAVALTPMCSLFFFPGPSIRPLGAVQDVRANPGGVAKDLATVGARVGFAV